MALVKCKECGGQVSTEAKACPSCGAKPPKRTSTFTWIIAAIFAVVIFQSISKSGDGSNQPTSQTASHSASSTSITQPPADPQKELRFQKTVIAAATLKKAMRDPDSLVWESIYTNDDASVICLEYRAKNGFGGMNREFAAIAKGKFSKEASVWNKQCANKTMNDMMYVRYALK